MTKEQVEKKYGVKLIEAGENIYSDGYFYYVKGKKETTLEFLDIVAAIIKAKKLNGLEIMKRSAANHQLLLDMIDCIEKDRLNELEILEEGEDFIVFIYSGELHKFLE